MRIMGQLAAVVLLVCGVATAQDAAEQITFGTKQDVDPMVSPNSDHLAFASNRTGEFNIYLLTFGKSGIVQVTQSGKNDRHPQWSADSKTLIFDSERTGHGDLYQTAADGSSGYLQLTDREDIEKHPSYRPRRGGILFVDSPKKMLQLRPKTTIVLAEDDKRANNAISLGEGDQPRFSPDGKSIVFTSRRTKNKDVWLMDADGGLPRQLTTDPADDEDPCFSPDGKYIVFSSNRTGNEDLWLVSVDGGNARQLTSTPQDDTQPCWSVGGYIYFTRRTGDFESSIFRIRAPR